MTLFAEMIQANSTAGEVYLHVVGFKFPASVDDDAQAAIMAECRDLATQCGGIDAGILRFDIVRNVDPRKGYTWIEIAIFRDRDAFLAFHAHPAHQAFAQKMAQTAEVWVVLDTDQLGSWFAPQSENQEEV
jgi:quinol monooxygenase YgiN